jgi:hypothetical protein
MIKVQVLKGNDWVSVKRFETPVAAFAFAVEEAINVFGTQKKGSEHCFYFRAEKNGDGSIMAWLDKRK